MKTVALKSNAKRRTRFPFLSNKSGAAAVEFSIVAPLFLAIMFSMFEVGWFFYTNSVLDAATDRAARMVRTGQLQENGTLTTPEERFDFLYDEICDVVDTFGDCPSRLTMEVQTFTTFAELAAATAPMICADSPPDDIATIPFEPGDELQIVRIRVCLIYDTINPAIGANLAEGDEGQRHLISTMIFQNEPYEEGTT
ncbi:MAG: TadE/TadG family type IV pilus assembly protein [Hyphococcus sp.]